MPRQIDETDMVYVSENGKWHTLLACAIGKDGGEVKQEQVSETDATACLKCS